MYTLTHVYCFLALLPMYLFIHATSTYSLTRVHAQTNAHILTRTHAHTHTHCARATSNLCAHTCTHTHTHTYTHTHTHTYTLAYTHTHTHRATKPAANLLILLEGGHNMSTSVVANLAVVCVLISVVCVLLSGATAFSAAPPISAISGSLSPPTAASQR